jgi:hypothetical protein
MNEKMRMGWLLLGFGTSSSPLLSSPQYVVVASSIVASVCRRRLFYRRLILSCSIGMVRRRCLALFLLASCTSRTSYRGPHRRYCAPREPLLDLVGCGMMHLGSKASRTSTLTTVCIWDASKVTPVCKWEESRSNFPGFKTICKRELYANGR